MRHWIYLVATGSLLAGQPALSETVAITHAKAWTMTATEPVENATIVITDGKITSVTPGGAAPPAARLIDAKGRPVTPGLISAASHLGLLEVSNATETVDSGVKSGSLGAAFDVQYAINANSTLIQLARADGVSRAITYPVHSGVAPISGTGALLRLLDSSDLLERSDIGVFAVVGGRSSSDAGGSRAAQWKLLRNALDAAKTGLAAKASPATRTPEFLALEPVLAGKVPLGLSVDRESDIRQAIALASDYRLKVVIIGGVEAWMAADALAAARIPVILDPEVNLPGTFDELGARLDNASLLHKAGVTIATVVVENGIQQSYNAGLSMREGAGLAVANGLPYIDGLKSITSTPAQIWGMADRCGTLASGRDADLVIWDGDPLEPATLAVTVLIAGKEMSLVTHQTELRDRYLPKAGVGGSAHRP
jgi:imidazolonepropionase-like amidohydrolase